MKTLFALISFNVLISVLCYNDAPVVFPDDDEDIVVRPVGPPPRGPKPDVVAVVKPISPVNPPNRGRTKPVVVAKPAVVLPTVDPKQTQRDNLLVNVTFVNCANRFCSFPQECFAELDDNNLDAADTCQLPGGGIGICCNPPDSFLDNDPGK